MYCTFTWSAYGSHAYAIALKAPGHCIVAFQLWQTILGRYPKDHIVERCLLIHVPAQKHHGILELQEPVDIQLEEIAL